MPWRQQRDGVPSVDLLTSCAYDKNGPTENIFRTSVVDSDSALLDRATTNDS